MVSFKQALSVILITLSAAGCGGAKLSPFSSAGAGSGDNFEPLDVPKNIRPDEKTLYGRDLAMLPKDHTSRHILRDRLVELVASEFAKTGDDRVTDRLKLFEEALGFHHPSDFKPGGVAPGVEPMAKWVVEVFGKRGDEAVVLAALRILMFDDPRNMDVKEQYLELYDWSESIRKSIPNPVDRLSSLITLYLRLVELVPDREVVDNLASLYVERHKTVIEMFSSQSSLAAEAPPLQILMQSRIIQNVPIELIYIFSLTGDPAGARSHLEELASGGGRILEYIELLDRIFQKRDEADSYFTLANHLQHIKPSAALKAAILARAADREDSRFPLFIGMLYEKMDLSECAFDFFVEAAEIAPSQDVYIQVLELYSRTLYRVFAKNLQSPTRRAIAVGDGLVDHILRLYPDGDHTDLRIVLASFLYTMGEIEYDNGDIDSSLRHLQRSFEVLSNLRSLVKLSEAYYMLGQFKEGIDTLDKAQKLVSGQENPRGYWRAILLENRGNLTHMTGNKDQALKHYRDALVLWDTVQVPTEQAPTIAIRRGILLDRLGDLKGSRESFTQAIRLAPNQQSTYAQLLSFLVIRGRLEDAKKFYRLAHNQDKIEDMWKIYYSLWVEGLSLRTTNKSFTLASGYLKQSKGTSWQDSLAKFFSGEINEDQLKTKVTNFPEEIEMEYYVAVKEMARGRGETANKRLRKVLASKLLGFFEYQMAFAIIQSNPGMDHQGVETH